MAAAQQTGKTVEPVSTPSKNPLRFIVNSQARTLGVLALLLTLPFFWTAKEPKYAAAHVPYVHSGDEPHYLVYLNSLQLDGDLNLANNYASVHEGSNQAGARFARAPLDHHSIWFIGEERMHWHKYFALDKFDRGPKGWLPHVREGMDPAKAPPVELPWNHPGLSIVLAPLLWGFRGSTSLEPAALAVSALMILVAAWAFRRLAFHESKDQAIANTLTLAVFLGSPLWFYGRTLFSEPWVVGCVTMAYCMARVDQRYVIAGLFAGLTLFIKPVAALLIMPLLVSVLLTRKLVPILKVSIGPALGLAGLMYLQFSLYHGQSAPDFDKANFLHGLIITFLWPSRGLLSTAPVMAVAILGWPRLVKGDRWFWAPLIAMALYICTMAWFRDTQGGASYAMRYQVALLPLLGLGLIPLWKDAQTQPVARTVIVSIMLLSILIGTMACIEPWRAWDSHPLEMWIRPIVDIR